MTDYKAIKGKTILNIASDLDNAEGEGEIWFNTTSSDYKTIVKAAGSWSTGGSLNTGRSSMAATGTRDVGLAIGGGEPANSAKVESYDGSSWTETHDINTARRNLGASGTTTAALVFGGDTKPPATY